MSMYASICSGVKRQERVRRREEENRKEREFRQRLIDKHGLDGHPKESVLYQLAYDYGHSAGWTEVEMYYDDLAELLKQ